MSETHPPRRRLIARPARTIGAVLAGVFATFILSVATDLVSPATDIFPP